ncbi:hypothetical protein NUU61_008636 [Penicillium alfredii]|uniref:Uncharacterized protein n=1 Tax=Penicillium alfredii TaxID=1506179 RepID=A0A9W9ELI9_9EURO|nr:uncharacterized protein NUU61_008636 [Penicillium alfredii]KAJ5084057.1 hypothetical protein NUU61_008636 [Penicillium alfredii]
MIPPSYPPFNSYNPALDDTVLNGLGQLGHRVSMVLIWLVRSLFLHISLAKAQLTRRHNNGQTIMFIMSITSIVDP